MNLVPLVKLVPGDSGIVMDIVGGRGVMNRLCSLGIIPGKKITKINSMMMRGPVIVRVGSTEIALGFGMASKVMVKKN
jgi:ferrous iron transport protein A